MVSKFILEGRDPLSQSNIKKSRSQPNTSISEGGLQSGLWTMEQLQAYFCTIKTLRPTLSYNANRILGSYYQAQRRADSRNAARTTVRMLESLVRSVPSHFFIKPKFICVIVNYAHTGGEGRQGGESWQLVP